MSQQLAFTAAWGAVMRDVDYLSLQVNIICLLLFVFATAAIIGRPDWFH